MGVSFIDVLGLTYLIGLLYKTVESCKLMKHSQVQGAPVLKTLTVLIFAVTWPVEPLIVAYLKRKGHI